MQPNVFGESVLDDALDILEEMLGLNFNPFAFESPRKGKDLTNDIRAPFGADFNCFQDFFWPGNRLP